MGGLGKTTLAEVVYKEVSSNFDDSYFLQNVSEKLEKQGSEFLRNELLSKLLKQEIRIDTPSIGSTLIQERLNNKRVFVVLDDVNDSDLIDYFGVQHFGHGSKILVTSRDKQVLKNVVDKIHEVKKLNEDDSLQLFSKFAFKQLSPVACFRDLSNKFVKYAQGSPLALKVLGPTLYQKPKAKWESALDKLKECPDPKILKVLKFSFDGLDEVEKNIFLDIACFFTMESVNFVEYILSYSYDGVPWRISNLIDKCLFDRTDYGSISMHDLMQEMGRDIVRRESTDPGKRSRLWSPKDVYRVLKYNKGTESIEGIMLDVSQIDELHLCPTVFENMVNLRFLKFNSHSYGYPKKLCKFTGHLVSLPDELRFLWWEYYPFKSLPSNFNPKNLVDLHLWNGNMEQLWNEDHQDLINLRVIDLTDCKNLRKIPKLLGAINLKSLICTGCESLVELPCLNHLTSLNNLELQGCCKLKKFPEVPRCFPVLYLQETGIEEVPDSIEHLLQLRRLDMRNSRVENVSSNISKLEYLHSLILSHCPIAEFPEIPKSLTKLNLSGTQIEEVPPSIGCLNKLLSLNMSGSSIQNLQCNINLSGGPSFSELNSRGIPIEDVPSSIPRFRSLLKMKINHCKSLKLLSELPPRLRYLDAHDCTSLEKVSFTDHYLYQPDPRIVDDTIKFSNCFNLSQDSIDNIVANAMLRIGSLAKQSIYKDLDGQEKLFCCLPGNEISTKIFEYQSTNSSIVLKICPYTCSGSRFLAFALCLVVDLTHRHKYENILFICEYQLTALGGDYEKFKSDWFWIELNGESAPKYLGDHVLILFSGNMVKDEDYEKASFEFYIKTAGFFGEEGTKVDDIKVKKCGVHVFYVDAESSTDNAVESSEECNSDEMSSDESDEKESYTDSVAESSEEFYTDEMSSDESYKSFDSEEDVNIEEVHDDNY